MKTQFRKSVMLTLLPGLFLALTVQSSAQQGGVPPPADTLLDKKEIAKRKVMQRFGQNISVDDNGIPTHLTGARLSRGITAEDRVEKAYQFFELHKDIFQLEDPRKEFMVRESSGDQLGRETVRFYQVVNGVKVRHAGYIIHIKPEGIIWSVSGGFNLVARNVDTTPLISREEAEAIAISDPRHEGKSAEATNVELMIARFEGRHRLTWHLGLRGGGGLGSWEYFIDAHTGEILQARPADRF